MLKLFTEQKFYFTVKTCFLSITGLDTDEFFWILNILILCNGQLFASFYANSCLSWKLQVLLQSPDLKEFQVSCSLLSNWEGIPFVSASCWEKTPRGVSHVWSQGQPDGVFRRAELSACMSLDRQVIRCGGMTHQGQLTGCVVLSKRILVHTVLVSKWRLFNMLQEESPARNLWSRCSGS